MRQIYTNGRIYTVTKGWAEAFVIEEGRFSYVGTNEGAMAWQEADAVCVDLEGQFVTAGFNDSHMHVLGYGYALGMVDLASNTQSLEAMKEAITTFIKTKQPSAEEWIRGRGWNHDYFEDTKRFPTRYDLDEVCTSHPICIIRACGHTCVVNSKALEVAGITKDTPQIEGGMFDVDDNGEPLGIFRENALGLIYDKIPAPTKDELKNMIQIACKSLNTYGVTSAQTDDFIVFPGVSYQEVIDAYQELEQEGQLSVKIYEQAQLVNEEELQHFLQDGYTTGCGTQGFRIGPLKMLGDGSLGSRTAYMSEPYADDPSTRGIPVYTQEQFDTMIGLAHEKGMQVAVHGIGDGIMNRVIKAIENALKMHPRENHRHGIVHCQITTPEIIQQIKALDLCVYIQSIFLDYDINIVEERVGKERAKTSYNFKTLLDQGTIVGNGSDCPVEMPNVMKGIQCAVTRQNLSGTKGPYLESEALSLEESIYTYTMMGAYTSFEEHEKGSIEVGKVADFVVIKVNPFEIQKQCLGDITVEATYSDGRCVYKK